jgi:nucleoside-diphosphate-sugar epimerase
MVDLGHVLNHGAVLVTGAEGYLGTHVLELLNNRKIYCLGTARKSNKNIIGCDLTSRSEVKELFKKVRPEAIIHCAASVPKEATAYDDDNAAKDSLLIVENIATFSECSVTFISSMTVYENEQMETGLSSEDLIVNPTSAYAVAKLKAENIFSNRCKNGFMALRMPGLFGSTRKSGLLYNVTKSFLQGQTPVLDAPFPLWAALDVRDAAEVCVDSVCLANYPDSEIINIGYNETFCIGKTIAMLADICQVDYPALSDNGPEFKVNLSLQEKYFNLCSISYRQRLERFVEDIKSSLK